ncbi:MAG: hypothetical protein ACYCWW_01810 [Deltaproteobacteria bacterium]
MRKTLALTIAAVSLSACVGNTLIPDAQREQIEDDLAGHVRFLKLAVDVTPFFRDAGKLLLTAQAPDELDLLDSPQGSPIDPGKPIALLPPGTKLRIAKVSFATAFEVTARLPLTPRFNPWIYLYPPDDVEQRGRPYIIVLRPDIRTHDEFLQEVARYLVPVDPTPELRSFPADVQAAIAKKALVVGMTPGQVEMAWGYPERIHIDGPTKTQRWTWPDDKQKAWFSGDQLAGWDDHGQQAGSPAGAAQPH